ncbi:aminotransferase class V-fold PLP-dependent enzyme [Amycolatopsis sp. WAC 01376]|uniref:aminotransferase class V-fold PLP-dependent enzyme n=1 Tax=Amycolatopsis sp. WAC 01376 TaxID=2203195 RepID=UPI003517A6E2
MIVSATRCRPAWRIAAAAGPVESKPRRAVVRSGYFQGQVRVRSWRTFRPARDSSRRVVAGSVKTEYVGQRLDMAGIAVRTGRHCAALVCDRFDVPATVRISFALYNTHDDIDHLVSTLRRLHTHKAVRPVRNGTAPGPAAPHT